MLDNVFRHFYEQRTTGLSPHTKQCKARGGSGQGNLRGFDTGSLFSMGNLFIVSRLNVLLLCLDWLVSIACQRDIHNNLTKRCENQKRRKAKILSVLFFPAAVRGGNFANESERGAKRTL